MSFFLIIRVLVPEFIMIFTWIMLQGFVVLTNPSLPRDSQHSGLSMSIILWLIAIICIVLGLKRLASASRFKFPLPPGPPADPFIGHLRYMSQKRSCTLVCLGIKRIPMSRCNGLQILYIKKRFEKVTETSTGSRRRLDIPTIYPFRHSGR